MLSKQSCIFTCSQPEKCLFSWVCVYLWKVQQNVVGVICVYRQQMKLFVSCPCFHVGFSDDDGESACRRKVCACVLNSNDVKPSLV